MGNLYRPASRFRFIDGLRGLAAVSVMLHHGFAFGNFGNVFGESCPTWLHGLAEFGRRGVQVFFVISGFVIAHALRDTRLSSKSVGNFIARRQVRLNPAYWLCTLLAFWRLRLAWDAHPHDLAQPRLLDLLLNGLYLQRITGRSVFLGSSWTLCLEMQLYIVFVLIVWLEQIAANRRSRDDELSSPASHTLGPPLVMWLALISVWSRVHLVEDMEAWWFTQAWNLFALGVLTYWAINGRCRCAWMWLLLTVIFASGIWYRQEGMIVGALTAVVIYIAAMRGCLGSWLAWRPVQYLGAVSYSLYLVHNEVLARMSRLGERLTGNSLTSATLWTAAACMLSVMAAHVLYVYVERPTMRVGAAMKRWTRRDRGAAAVEPAPATLAVAVRNEPDLLVYMPGAAGLEVAAA